MKLEKNDIIEWVDKDEDGNDLLMRTRIIIHNNEPYGNGSGPISEIDGELKINEKYPIRLYKKWIDK